MSATYWDPELGRGGGGGEPQQLQLNGFTLSLVPDGGSVQLPVGFVSSIGSVLIVSTVQARDKVIVGPNSNVVITSTGTVDANVVLSQLTNAFAVNATNTTTTSLSTVNGQITNLFTPNGNALQFNAQNISSGLINTSSIKAGGITISKDTGFGYSKITGDEIGLYTNLTQYAPAQNINGRFFNGENYNATSSINVGSNIIASNVNSNAIITLNNHILSNTNTNLTYDSNPIYTGQRGDVSQWAQFPANGFVNVNGNGVGGIGTLYVDGEANLANKANIGTNKQDATVNILTQPYTGVNPFNYPGPGNLTVGFRRYAPGGILPNLSAQPNVNLYGRELNLAAGAPDFPAYFEGRTINIDAYAGLSPVPSIVPVLPNANSYINITAHGNSVSALNQYLGSGSGNITLRANNSYFPPGVVPNPLAPGRIYLDAAVVDIGNANYTGLGESAKVNLQAAIVQVIAGLEIGGILPGTAFSHFRIRSRDGVVIENTPLGNDNRDSRLYVREVIGYSNFVNDATGPPALTLDGLDGGLTLNNFIAANGQGDGADLNNIATMSGAYPTNVQNQIDALQNIIANLSTTGGTSNIAQWSAYPAISTVVANRDLNFTGATASISSLNGVQFNNTAGSLTNTYQKRVYLDGRTATTGSTMMYYDLSAVSFINPINLGYNDLRGKGMFFGPSNYLGVSSGYLQFNGSNLISTSGTGGGNGTVGPNPLVSSITIQTGSGNPVAYIATGGEPWFGGPEQTLMFLSSAQYAVGRDIAAGRLYSFNSNSGVGPFKSGTFAWDSIYFQGNNSAGNTSYLLGVNDTNLGSSQPAFALSNISTINGIPISTITGGSGPSSIQNWSYFPVLSNSIQFGSQSAWIKGDGNALFTASNGADTVPVLAKSFTVYDPDNISVIRNIGFDSNGILTAKRSNEDPSDFKVSSLYLNENPLTTDGTDLYLNGVNIGSGNTATWANYPATSTIRGSNIVLSNNGTSFSMFDTAIADPRSTSIFMNPFQFQMINKNPVNRNIFGMTNSCNAFIIQNDAQGAYLYCQGNPYKITLGADVVIDPTSMLSAVSTSSRSLVVSSMMLNGNNTLTASGGSLFFNGSVINASNTVQQWSQFPAISNVNLANYDLANASNITSSNYVTNVSGYAITPNGTEFTGSVFPLQIKHTLSLGFRPGILMSGNGAWNGGLYASNSWVAGDKGFCFTIPGPTPWNNIEAPTSNNFTLNQYSSSNLISTGRIYDTTFNKLPTFPIVYCGAQDTQIPFNYGGGTSSSWTVISPLGTITPMTNQGIVSFSVIPPSSYATSNCYIGVGLVGTNQYSNVYVTRIDQYDSNLTTFDRKTLLVDFTGYVGSNFNFRLAGIPSGTFTFADCYYKPLPN